MSFDEKDAPTDALLEVPKVVVAEEFDWLVKRSGKARGVVGLPGAGGYLGGPFLR